MNDIMWYIDRLKLMISECEAVLAKRSQLQDNSKNMKFVNDHTYDIEEIFPYNIFFANEDILV